MNEKNRTTKTLNKPDLVSEIAKRCRYTKKSATQIVDDFTQTIIDLLAEGNSVSIFGFGHFDIIERAPRSCPNPATGERISIPAHYIPRFYPYKNMRIAVKIWEDELKRGAE